MTPQNIHMALGHQETVRYSAANQSHGASLQGNPRYDHHRPIERYEPSCCVYHDAITRYIMGQSYGIILPGNREVHGYNTNYHGKTYAALIPYHYTMRWHNAIGHTW